MLVLIFLALAIFALIALGLEISKGDKLLTAAMTLVSILSTLIVFIAAFCIIFTPVGEPINIISAFKALF